MEGGSIGPPDSVEREARAIGLTDVPFGGPWREVDLGRVERFMADATDEGLTWEAKGSIIRPEHVLRAGSGFANSVLGGILVLGAQRTADRGWTLPGIDLPAEPAVWISAAMRRLRPVPAFDVKSFGRSDGRPVVVVIVRPVATPPCLTPDGQAFERTTGATEPVRDPAALARLFDRGEAARDTGRRNADETIRLFGRPPNGNQADSVVGVSMAATGYSGPIGAALFTEAFAAELRAAARAAGRQGGISFAVPRARVLQNEMLAWIEEPHGEPRGVALAREDGSVSVVRVHDPESVFRPEYGQDTLVACWKQSARLVRAIGGYGETRLVVAARLRTNATHHVRRWLVRPDPEDDDVHSVLRELERAQGDPAWEPS